MIRSHFLALKWAWLPKGIVIVGRASHIPPSLWQQVPPLVVETSVQLRHRIAYHRQVFNLACGAEPPVCTGELKHTVDRSIFITSGGTPGLCWRNPRVPGNPGWKSLPAVLTYYNMWYSTPWHTQYSNQANFNNQHFHNIHDLFWVFFSQCDKACPLKFFDTARCRHFGSTSPPVFLLWRHHCNSLNLGLDSCQLLRMLANHVANKTSKMVSQV